MATETPEFDETINPTSFTWKQEFWRAEQLVVDPNLQRELVPVQLNRIKGANYRRESVGTLCVSKRANGARVILDGQHRWHVIGVEDADYEIPCEVFYNLTREEEAKLFLDRNNFSVNAPSKFKALVVAQHPMAVKINAIFENNGIELGNTHRKFSAISTAMSIYRWPDGGPECLDWALDVAASTWSDAGATPTAANQRPYRGAIIAGLARLTRRYPNLQAVDLVYALTVLGENGPATLVLEAAQHRSVYQAHEDVCFARTLLNVFNKHKAKGVKPLAKWDESLDKRGTNSDLFGRGALSEQIADTEDSE